MSRTIYCGNCGKRGHIYRHCYHPIISIGIICFQYHKQFTEDMFPNYIRTSPYNYLNNQSQNMILQDEFANNCKFLLIRRRHSVCFVDFIRGNYELQSHNDINYIISLFNRMTPNEIDLIKNNTFDIVWTNLWNGCGFTKNIDISRHKFNSLKDGITIGDKQYNINNMTANYTAEFTEPEWEFPKGKRNIRETDIDCANREFWEETGMNQSSYSILNINPIEELFTGNNHIKYKCIYFLAQTNIEVSPIINANNPLQSNEISEIGFFTFNEALNKIRPYQTEKRECFIKVAHLLNYIHKTNGLNSE